MLLLLLQLGIPGQVGFQEGDLLGQLGLHRLLVQLPGPDFLRVCKERRLDGQLLLQGSQGIPAALLLLSQGELGVDLLQFLVQRIQLGLEQVRALLVSIQDSGNQGGGFLHGQLPRLGQPKLGGKVAFFVAAHSGDILLHAFPGVAALVVQGAGLPFQAFLQALEQVGFEYLSENLLPVLGRSQQQLEEIPLGNHGDLQKLVPVNAQNVPDGGVHLPGPGDGGALRENQGGLRSLRSGARAVELGPLVFRHPAHLVALAPAGKFQLHKGGGFRGGIFGAEHAGASVVAAGLAVEGEGDGIEQGGFSRPGVPGDQIQAVLSQAVHIQHRFSGIGAEGGEGEFQWSHGQASSIRDSSSSTKTSCSWVMGRLFCSA